MAKRNKASAPVAPLAVAAPAPAGATDASVPVDPSPAAAPDAQDTAAPPADAPAPEASAPVAPLADALASVDAAPTPFAVPTGFLPIEYIGRRATHIDGLYGTRIEWAAVGTVRLVPEDIAAKMLKFNRDVYRLGEYQGEPAPTSTAPVEQDTQRQELDLTIQTMDKDALENFARTHFRQELDKRRSVDTLRQEVARMIDQFGAP